MRDGHRADPLSLVHEVDEHSAAVALLDVPAVERREFAPAQGEAKSTAKIARSRFPSMASRAS